MAHLNLLPYGFRRRTLVTSHLRQWVIACAVAWVALVPTWWLKQSKRQAAIAALDPLEQNYALLTKLQAENRQMKARLNDVGTRETLFGELQAEPPSLATIALVSQSARGSAGQLVVEHLAYDSHYAERQQLEQRKKDPKASKELARQTIDRELTLIGVGMHNLAIAGFVVALRDSAAFQRVDLKSAVQDPQGGRIKYQVQCHF
jgi:Tfp pilus assembly protein PilN